MPRQKHHVPLTHLRRYLVPMLETGAPDLARRGATELVSLLAQRLQGARAHRAAYHCVI